MFPKFLGPICNNNNNKLMTKLSLMISHMSFMTNGWYLPHHVLNDYCLKWFVRNDFKVMNHFSPL